MSWGYWVAAAVALGVLVGALLWMRSTETDAARRERLAQQLRDAEDRERRQQANGQHTYGRCPACWAYVVKAFCFDDRFRIFDAAAVQIADENPPPEPVAGEPTTVTLERRLAAARRARDLNDQLWIFDPNRGPAMHRYVARSAAAQDGEEHRPQRHVRQGAGLTEHFCALGLDRRPGEPQWESPVPWRTNGLH